MRPRLGIMIGLVLVATLVASTAIGALARGGADSLPPLSAAAEEPLQYVGDAGDLRLGVSIVSETEAVAYLCDGKAVGVWFTGTVDLDSGDVSLKSKDGATITLNLNAEPVVATAVVDGETTTFTLEPVTGNGGVFRSVSTAKGQRWTTGWIIANDGTIVGLTGTPTGKTVAAISSAPVPQSSGGADPVTTGAVRCALLAARISRAREQAVSAQQQGNQAGVNAANNTADELNDRAREAGCAGFGAGSGADAT